MAEKKKKIIIIDAFALIFRAYYALPPLTSSDGTVVNAVYGFYNTLFNIIRDYKPDYLCVAFDEEAPTFRKEAYEEYKAQREAPPEDFKPQIPIIIDLLKTLNISQFSKPGYEADDVIGTICALKSVDNKDTMSYILTGDLDTLQLVDDNTHVITFKRGMSETIEYDEKAVSLKYEGLRPDQLIDMKALKGDASDNIPGVPGIGEKTALKLIKQFGSLEKLYKDIDMADVSDRFKNLLREHEDQAHLSKELVTIVTNVPIDFDLEECRLKPYDKQEVTKILQKLEFKSLIGKLPDAGGMEDSEIIELAPHDLAAELRYTLVNDDESFETFLKELKKQETFAYDTETTGLDPFSAELLGISFSWDERRAYYLSITSKEGDGLFAGTISNSHWLEQLKPIFADEKVEKVGHNIKFDMEVLEQYGFEISGVHFDTMVGAYVLRPGERTYSLDNLALQEFSYRMISYDELTGKGKDKIPLIDVELDKTSFYACEDADFTWRLYNKQIKELKKEGLYRLMDEIEVPLIHILAGMESHGVLIDTKYLKTLANEVGKEIKRLEEKIFEQAGHPFNVASPLQLQEVLFEELSLSTTGIGKTKSGFSTAAPQLEKLLDAHPIIQLIMDYRELTKLKSTYLDALPKMINEKTGRVHTSYNQTVAATGRLSSTDPNLQNIPIRSELGRQVRNAFIAPDDFVIMAADYSQIELRLAAHYSDDKNLLKIFKEGKDVHTSTAATIHGIPEEEVTKQIRSTAKEVNFGIIYGLGPVGLAQRTGMSRTESKEFIENYFKKFPGIKDYIDKTIEDAREKGYVETLFGRRRYLPELSSNNNMLKSQAERIAINLPLQGTVADLVKIAMINVAEKLSEVSPKSAMIMQVHDELIFEVPKNEVQKVAEFVKKTMEEAHTFKVPIEVDVAAGKSWGELEKL